MRSPIFVEVNIGMDLQALQEIAVHRRVAGTEAGCVVGFETFAQGDAQRNVAFRIGGPQRDVFEPIERFGAQSGIGKDRPVLRPAVRLNRGPLGYSGFPVVCLRTIDVDAEERKRQDDPKRVAQTGPC
jgi:molybdate transport system ATP-binding protein